MESNDRNIWKRLFINDPIDKRAIVEKRIGYGYTINLGTSGGKILFFFIVVLPFILTLILLILYYFGKL